MLAKNTPLFKEWERATDALAAEFARKYFGRDAETHWIADEIGGVYEIADYFFDVNDMADFLRYSYGTKTMFEYYDYALELNTKGQSPINIKSWRHFKKPNQ